MTREIKLALILGSALALIVGVLVSDHLSAARRTQIAEISGELGASLGTQTRPLARPRDANANWPEVVATLPTSKVEEPKPTAVASNTPTAQAPQTPAVDHDADLIDAGRNQGVEFTRLTNIDTLVLGDKPTTVAPATPPMKEHVIREGDTLWSIAQKYYGDGRQHARIEEANHEAFARKKGLEIGQKLMIPARQQPGADAALANAKPEDSTVKDAPKEAKPGKYVVKPGDTLAGVARKTLGAEKRWEEILALNSGRIPDPDSLSVGTELRLPQR